MSLNSKSKKKHTFCCPFKEFKSCAWTILREKWRNCFHLCAACYSIKFWLASRRYFVRKWSEVTLDNCNISCAWSVLPNTQKGDGFRGMLFVIFFLPGTPPPLIGALHVVVHKVRTFWVLLIVYFIMVVFFRQLDNFFSTSWKKNGTNIDKQMYVYSIINRIGWVIKRCQRILFCERS